MEVIENKHSSGAAGMEAAASGREKEVMMANERNIRCTDLDLRFLAFALTLVAAIVLGLDKETAYVSIRVVPTLPPLNIHVTAKWHYRSAFVYFVVANSIACAYAAISLILMMANGGKRKGLSLLIIIFDVVMVAILFSGYSAAAAVGIIGAEGNSHVQWNKVCHNFAKFCRRGLAALSFSLAGSVVFLLRVLLATWNLMHKKH